MCVCVRRFGLLCAVIVIKLVTGKKECPPLKEKSKMYNVKSAGLTATIQSPTPGIAAQLSAPFQMQVQRLTCVLLHLCLKAL